MERFVASHGPRLRAAVARDPNLLSPDLVDDIVQDVLVKLLPVIGGFSDDEAAFRYATHCARNRVIDLLRRDRRLRDPLWMNALDALHTRSVRDHADSLARRDAVRSALRRLPTVQRSAVLLVDLAGVPPVEAAAMLGAEPGVFKANLQRGRAAMRAALSSAFVPLGRLVSRRRTTASAFSATAPVGVAALAAYCLTVLHAPVVVPVPHRSAGAGIGAAAVLLLPPSVVLDAPAATAPPRPRPRPLPLPLPQGTGRPHEMVPSESPSPSVPAGVCVGKTCLGSHLGDTVCVTDGEGNDLACAKQEAIAVCEAVTGVPAVRCERHDHRNWIVPPSSSPHPTSSPSPTPSSAPPSQPL